jgi:hypothetical protein
MADELNAPVMNARNHELRRPALASRKTISKQARQVSAQHMLRDMGAAEPKHFAARHAK